MEFEVRLGSQHYRGQHEESPARMRPGRKESSIKAGSASSTLHGDASYAGVCKPTPRNTPPQSHPERRKARTQHQEPRRRLRRPTEPGNRSTRRPTFAPSVSRFPHADLESTRSRRGERRPPTREHREENPEHPSGGIRPGEQKGERGIGGVTGYNRIRRLRPSTGNMDISNTVIQKD